MESVWFINEVFKFNKFLTVETALTLTIACV